MSTVTQSQIDRVLAMRSDYRTGNIRMSTICNRVGLSEPTVRRIWAGNAAAGVKRRRWQSDEVERMVGTQRMRLEDERKQSRLRPTGIRAPHFSDDWMRQNSESFDRWLRAGGAQVVLEEIKGARS
jgi:hypothetical protein